MRAFAIVFILAAATAGHARASLAPLTVKPAATFTSGILQVERFGNPAGRAIVFVPGLFCGPWVWTAQINELSKQYDVYAVTVPGFNGLPMIRGGNLMARATASLHVLIAGHHLRRPVVVGHSLGGTITVLFGETYPRDASNIVTVEGGYPAAPTQKQRDASVAQSARPYQGISQAALGPALRQNILQYTITSPADVAAVEPLAGRSDPRAVVAWMRAALSLDLTPRLSAITVPFTAIVPFDARIDPYQGFKTLQAKRAAYAAWVAHAPQGKLILIPGARHFVMIDRPREFAQALDTALAR